jgi:amidohydrolase
MTGLRAQAAELHEDLVALRRELHRIPEVGLRLPRTQERVLAALDGLPLEVRTGREVDSVTAVLRGGRPGPTVLLRGDMDGLPMTERTDVEYRSEHPEAMHACGHDLHTAGLVGAARLLSARQAELTGDVVFMFQPGEEGFDGAGYMIREGVLDAAGKKADAAYGLHVFSSGYARGVFHGRPGPMMAASDGLFVTVRGRGGHGAQPHMAADPVPVACEIVTALQTMVTRKFDAFDPVVVTVGVLRAGTKRNIIPDEAHLEATVRTFSAANQRKVRAEAERLCRDLAAAHGVEVDLRYETEYPVTVNDEAEAGFVADTVREVFGPDRFAPMPFPITGSEDFSRVLDEVPGSYVFLGACRTDDPERAPGNHSPLADFDDAVLTDGVTLLCELALRRMARTA